MPNSKLRLLLLALLVYCFSSFNGAYAASGTHSYVPQKSLSKASYKKSRYAQTTLRSRSDVMNEVKQRYNAKVLKISLNEKAGVYNVRMLMPSGKVRSIKVSAR